MRDEIIAERGSANARTATFAAIGFLFGFALPFVFALRAWPEIVVPAYFVSRGGVLYDTISFIHTPLLILTTALAGSLFGFSATLFRVIVGVMLGCCGAMIAAGTRRRSWIGIVAALPFFLLAILYAEEPSLWPDPLVGTFFLGGTLFLDRFEKHGRRSILIAAAITFGTAILVKQTSAWAGLAALVWILMRARQDQRFKNALTFAACLAAPYALFVVAWAVIFRTFMHVRWTLVMPLLTGHAAEIRIAPTAAEAAGALVFYVVVLAFVGFRSALPRHARFRSVAPWIAVASIGMAWPRWEVLHVSGGFGVLALLYGRSIAMAPAVLRRLARSRAAVRAAAPVGGFALLIAITFATLISCVPLIPFSFRGPVLFWDDSVTARTAADVTRRVGRGGRLLIFNAPFETVYAITGTTTPDGRYVNPTFWYYLNKFDIGPRLVAALQKRPGTPILYRELSPEDDPRGRDSVVYRYLARTPALAPASNGAVWRASVAPRGGAQ